MPYHLSPKVMFLSSMLALWTIAAGSGRAAAEQPSWTTLARRTFTIRYHTSGAGVNDDAGIWSLNPDTGELRHLRPFSYNPGGCCGTDMPGGGGAGSYLAAAGDRLLFIAWPSVIEFDGASLRIVRRSPVLDPALEAPGWTVQGPVIDAGLAASTGLAEGVYGFAECLYPAITMSGWGGPGKDCQPTLFPGYSDPITSGQGEVLLRRSGGTRSFALEAALAAPEGSSLGRLITFDPSRNGFWMSRGSTLDFHPISGGVVQAASQSVDLGGLNPGGGSIWPEELLYQPERRVFLLGWYDDGSKSHFSVLDHDLGLVRDSVGHSEPATSTLTLAAFAGSPPAELVQTIPIVVHAAGRNGTFWTSDLYLYNASLEPTTVTVRRVVKPAEKRTIELPAHGSVTVADALAWAGGGPAGDGTKHDALVLTSSYRWGGNVVAAARVWTPDPDVALRSAGGTMGQAVPAVPDTVGYSNHLPEEADIDSIINIDGVYGGVTSPPFNAELLLDYREPGRFRHNLGVVNDEAQPLTVRLTWSSAWQLRADHGNGSRQSVTVPPHTVRVINIDDLFPAELRESYLPRLWLAADRPAAVWFTMVDNTTGDATFVPFTLLEQPGDPFTRAAVPAAAHLHGHGGIQWRTDLYSVAMSPERSPWDDLQAWFHPADPAAHCGGVTGEVEQEISGVLPMDEDTWRATAATLDPPWGLPTEDGWRNVYPDLVHRFAACAADEEVRGGFELETGSWMSGFTRTYTTRADGGTYGGMLPLSPPDGWPVQHFAGLVVGGAFRINVGLFNGDAAHPVVHRLTLYAANGTKVAEREITLKPWANLVEPLESLLGLAKGSLAAGTYGLTVLPLDGPDHLVEGRSWAFVSLVDNITGDSTNWW